jgi:penicillin-binding protein 1A
MGSRQGGSTISQQLARNLFPEEIGNSASVTRKIKEAQTAWKIERVYEKDEILEIYLNTVPFLYNAFGIEMAARTYFSTSARDLNWQQAATLVGMLKGTSLYNPKRHPDRALARRNVVLEQLAVTGRLPQATVDSLQTLPLGLRFERQPLQTSRAPHFTEHVRVQMEAWARENGYNLYGDGLVIHTTLDWRIQQAAAESVRRFGNALQAVADVEWARAGAERLGPTTEPYVTARRSIAPFERFWTLRRETANALIRETPHFERALAAGQPPEAALESLRADAAFLDSLREAKMRLEVAFSAIDPRSGQVRAWVGSRDYGRAPYDHVARMRRQPGSVFKPFLYARALEEGYSPNDRFRDEAVEIQMEDGVVWRPTNAVSESGADMSLSDALATSKNTIAVQLIQEVGPRDVARTARRMGVNQSEIAAVPSLALGTSEVSLLEMTSAHATIAGVGVYRPPVVVTHIEDRDGNEIARFAPDSSIALGDEASVLLLDMMRGVVDRGTGRDVRTRFGVRGDLAGKTGTTQDGADGWFLLMHPDLVAGAWVGFDDPRVTFRSAFWGQGGNNALRVVADFFQTSQRRRLIDASRTFPAPPEIPTERGLLARASDWVLDAFSRLLPDRSPQPGDAYGPRTPQTVRQPEPPRRARTPDRTPAPPPPEPAWDDPPPDEPVFDEPIWDEQPAIPEEAQEALDEIRRRAEDRARRAARDAEREIRDRIENAADAAAARAADEIRDRLPDLQLEPRGDGQRP